MTNLANEFLLRYNVLNLNPVGNETLQIFRILVRRKNNRSVCLYFSYLFFYFFLLTYIETRTCLGFYYISSVAKKEQKKIRY